MIAQFKRNIVDSAPQYDAVIPNAKMNDISISKTARLADTLDAIPQIVNNTLAHTEALAPKLKGKNLKQTCENIWDFLYHHIQYTEDKAGIEQVRTPARSWADRKAGIDCDCYTVFASSILSNLGIEHMLRIAAYKGKGKFQHIYVAVPHGSKTDLDNTKEYIIDPVLDKFDEERPTVDEINIKMELQVLEGVVAAGSGADASKDHIQTLVTELQPLQPQITTTAVLPQNANLPAETAVIEEDTVVLPTPTTAKEAVATTPTTEKPNRNIVWIIGILLLIGLYMLLKNDSTPAK